MLLYGFNAVVQSAALCGEFPLVKAVVPGIVGRCSNRVAPDVVCGAPYYIYVVRGFACGALLRYDFGYSSDYGFAVLDFCLFAQSVAGFSEIVELCAGQHCGKHVLRAAVVEELCHRAAEYGYACLGCAE